MRFTTGIIAQAISAHEFANDDRILGGYRCRCGKTFGDDWEDFTEHRAEAVRLALLVADSAAPPPSGRPFMTVQHLTSH